MYIINYYYQYYLDINKSIEEVPEEKKSDILVKEQLNKRQQATEASKEDKRKNSNHFMLVSKKSEKFSPKKYNSIPLKSSASDNHLELALLKRCAPTFYRKSPVKKNQDDEVIQELKLFVLSNSSQISVISLKSLLRIITYFYNSKLAHLKSNPSTHQNLSNFIYGELLNSKGLKQLADNKFMQILSGCLRYKKIPRVQMFGRFLGLYNEYALEDFRCFLETIDYLNQLDLVPKIENKDTEEKHIILFDKAMECGRNYFKTNIEPSEYKQFCDKVNSLKFAINVNTYREIACVDLDLFLEHILEVYSRLREKGKDRMEDLYASADFDSQGHLDKEIFGILLQVFEPSFYLSSQAQRIFEEFADLTDGKQEFLSFQGFSALSARYHLFSSLSQERLLGFPLNHNFSNEIKPLFSAFSSKLRLYIENQLIQANLFSPFWSSRLDECSKRLQNPMQKPKCAFLTFKIIQNYSQKQLAQSQLYRLFPSQLLVLT